MTTFEDKKEHLHDIDIGEDGTGECPDCNGVVMMEAGDAIAVCESCGEEYEEL